MSHCRHHASLGDKIEQSFAFDPGSEIGSWFDSADPAGSSCTKWLIPDCQHFALAGQAGATTVSCMDLPEHPYRLTRRVEFHQTDAAGLMHFATYFLFMEAAEAAIFRELGLLLLDTRAGQMIGFPRIDAQCRFRRPLHFDALVTIEVRLQAIEGNRLSWGFRFFNSADELTARGTLMTACVKRQPDGSLLSIDIPQNIFSALKQWCRNPADDVAAAIHRL